MTADTGTLPVDVPTPRKKYNDPKATESEMLDILERHYARTGNGGSGEYAFLRQVRNAAGFDAKRTFDAVVVGLPDERWGQKVVGVVALHPSHTPDGQALRSHARSRIAGYKVPRTIVFVDEVKRTPAGKADYKWAKAAADQPAPA